MLIMESSSQYSANSTANSFRSELSTEYRVLRTSFLTMLPRSPFQSDLQAPAAAKTSSQTPSTGHNGSAATCRAPRYTEREMRKPSQQTRRRAGLPAESEG